MKKPNLKGVKMISKIFLFLLMIHQWYLVTKYGIIWYEWILTPLLVLGTLWLIRLYSVTDGIINAVLKQDLYNKIKRTMINNYKRNKKNPN